MLGSVLILGELTKELQDLIGELIEEAEFKGKQVMPLCSISSIQKPGFQVHPFPVTDTAE